MCECDNFKNVVGALTYVSAVGSLYEYSTTPEFIFIFFKSQCFVNCVVRCRRSPWTRREPVWWRVDTITTYVSGTLPAWTRLCRPSGRCSPVSGESPSENTSSNINTLAWNMWLISFMQTFTTLSVPKCTHTHTQTHTNTHLLSFIEPHANSVASVLFLQNQQMVEVCGCLCICVFILWFTEAESSKFLVTFSFGELQDGAAAGFPLLRKKKTYATFNLITVWFSFLLNYWTNWASYRNVAGQWLSAAPRGQKPPRGQTFHHPHPKFKCY